MKEVFVISIAFLVLVAVLEVCDGRLCWMGRNGPRPFRYQIECRGSCAKRLCGKGCYEYGCYDIEKPEGCTKCEFDVPCCFCNKPLCNTGPVPDKIEPILVNTGLNSDNTGSVSDHNNPIYESTDLVPDITDSVSHRTGPFPNNVEPVSDNIRPVSFVDILRFLRDN